MNPSNEHGKQSGQEKQSAVNSAAQMALKLYLNGQKSSGGAGGSGGGAGGLLQLASKFLQ